MAGAYYLCQSIIHRLCRIDIISMGNKENIRHIDELKNEDWFNRPWVLLGTGPSLDNFNQNDWKEYNIAAVYDAYYACNYVDILFASDKWDTFHETHEHYWRNKNIRYVATRSINVNFIENYNNTVVWEYDCDQKDLNIKLFQSDPYPCSNTSSFVIMWLGKMGVKKIHTFGIDGGKGLSKYVSNGYIKSIEESTGGIDYDFTHENEGVYGHAQNYGIQLIKQ